MREEILKAIRTTYLRYGLKADSIEKLANTIEAHIAALGTTPETLQSVIDSTVKMYEPAVAIIQSEVDSRIAKPKPAPAPAPAPAPSPVPPAPEDAVAKLVARLELLEKEREAGILAASKKALISQATELTSKGGASKKTLLDAAIKLVDIKEGMTAQQIADAALVEYNKFQAELSGDGRPPVIPSKILSDAEIEVARKAAIAKSAEEYKKNVTTI